MEERWIGASDMDARGRGGEEDGGMEERWIGASYMEARGRGGEEDGGNKDKAPMILKKTKNNC